MSEQYRLNRIEDARELVAGAGTLVPVLDGQQVPYVNLDNAASTPALREVLETLNDFMGWYASVHRGTGFKSRLSTQAYDEAHAITGRFFKANPATNTVIFVRNTTEAVNRLANRFPFGPDDVVLSSFQEHHSNDLPWRRRAKVDYIAVNDRGALELDDLERKLRRRDGKVRLVTVTGASNVTGCVNLIHDIARLAHRWGAQVMVDGAQLAPHRAIDMRPDDDPGHIDYLTVSGHKMYAPFGTGALIGPAATFLQGDPDLVGGGVVELVTHDQVVWTGLPDKEEAGSPNVPGAVAMARALLVLDRIGMAAVARHEAELTAYALRRLPEIPGLTLFGETDPTRVRDRVGVIPFAMNGLPHGLVAAILGYEGGIGVRSGCFCAHPYVLRLLRLSAAESARYQAAIMRGDRSDIPGFVRASFGLYSTPADVDRLVEMLLVIARGEFKGTYRLDAHTGAFTPEGHNPDTATYWNWD
ncbi:MAG TPA: aminotransferase class V-fold PLP-dependent enzyme [Symbiobacteriaceae bacterium]|jgi:selenocysteine lyase/cysteine desulfurase